MKKNDLKDTNIPKDFINFKSIFQNKLQKQIQNELNKLLEQKDKIEELKLSKKRTKDKKEIDLINKQIKEEENNLKKLESESDKLKKEKLKELKFQEKINLKLKEIEKIKQDNDHEKLNTLNIELKKLENEQKNFKDNLTKEIKLKNKKLKDEKYDEIEENLNNFFKTDDSIWSMAFNFRKSIYKSKESLTNLFKKKEKEKKKDIEDDFEDDENEEEFDTEPKRKRELKNIPLNFNKKEDKPKIETADEREYKTETLENADIHTELLKKIVELLEIQNKNIDKQDKNQDNGNSLLDDLIDRKKSRKSKNKIKSKKSNKISKTKSGSKLSRFAKAGKGKIGSALKVGGSTLGKLAGPVGLALLAGDVALNASDTKKISKDLNIKEENIEGKHKLMGGVSGATGGLIDSITELFGTQTNIAGEMTKGMNEVQKFVKEIPVLGTISDTMLNFQGEVLDSTGKALKGIVDTDRYSKAFDRGMESFTKIGEGKIVEGIGDMFGSAIEANPFTRFAKDFSTDMTKKLIESNNKTLIDEQSNIFDKIVARDTKRLANSFNNIMEGNFEEAFEEASNSAIIKAQPLTLGIKTLSDITSSTYDSMGMLIEGDFSNAFDNFIGGFTNAIDNRTKEIDEVINGTMKEQLEESNIKLESLKKEKELLTTKTNEQIKEEINKEKELKLKELKDMKKNASKDEIAIINKNIENIEKEYKEKELNAINDKNDKLKELDTQIKETETKGKEIESKRQEEINKNKEKELKEIEEKYKKQKEENKYEVLSKEFGGEGLFNLEEDFEEMKEKMIEILGITAEQFDKQFKNKEDVNKYLSEQSNIEKDKISLNQVKESKQITQKYDEMTTKEQIKPTQIKIENKEGEKVTMKTEKHNTGGIVDSVLSYLTPGEGIMPVKGVKKLNEFFSGNIENPLFNTMKDLISNININPYKNMNINDFLTKSNENTKKTREMEALKTNKSNKIIQDENKTPMIINSTTNQGSGNNGFSTSKVLENLELNSISRSI